jgi:phosphatidylglycerophosphate synthase
MFDIFLRNFKDEILLKLSYFFKILHKLNVTPNMITFSGFLIGLLSVYYCYKGFVITAFVYWNINRIIDATDGKIII